MVTKVDDLIIPVYLNQRIVFDLIAMLQDGISTVTRITSMDSIVEKDSKNYGASFGLNQALSTLFKINVSGGRDLQKEGSSGIQKDKERVHTPASILQILRNILKSNDGIHVFNENYRPEPGHIIEFKADLRKNPIIQTMDTFVGIMDMAIAFTDEPKKSQNRQKKDENQKIKAQMEKFLEALKTGDTLDIVSDNILEEQKAVITLEREFLNDPSMSDLVDGHFNILGKVIRFIPDNTNSINLMRKTALSAMPENILKDMFAGLSDLSTNEGFGIPPLKWEIEGPVVQVIPIAIFA